MVGMREEYSRNSCLMIPNFIWEGEEVERVLANVCSPLSKCATMQ